MQSCTTLVLLKLEDSYIIIVIPQLYQGSSATTANMWSRERHFGGFLRIPT